MSSNYHIYDFLYLLRKFPVFALLYAFFLSILGVLTLIVYNHYGGGLTESVGTNMFDYIIAIVAWLVTTRPIYALTMHDLLTDQMFEILTLLLKQSYLEEETENSHANAELTLQLAHYVGSALIDRENHCELTEALREKTFGAHPNEIVIALDDKFRLFRMRQKLALPHALHGLCVVLIMGFHGILLPIILFDNSTWYSLIPNYILAVYTSGCIEVAAIISDPYKNIKKSEDNNAIKYFQFTYHEIIKRTIHNLKNNNHPNKKIKKRKTATADQYETALDELKIPDPKKDDNYKLMPWDQIDVVVEDNRGGDN